MYTSINSYEHIQIRAKISAISSESSPVHINQYLKGLSYEIEIDFENVDEN